MSDTSVTYWSRFQLKGSESNWGFQVSHRQAPAYERRVYRESSPKSPFDRTILKLQMLPKTLSY